jgi:hypothetical protein
MAFSGTALAFHEMPEFDLLGEGIQQILSKGDTLEVDITNL